MSSIEKFFTEIIVNKRLSWSNDSGVEISVGSFYGHIQQANAELASYIGETLGHVFSVWCNKDEDVEAGDTLTIATGDYTGTYIVKAIQVNSIGQNPHLELICVKNKI